MPVPNTPSTRKVLVLALLTVTTLVVYKAAEGHNDIKNHDHELEFAHDFDHEMMVFGEGLSAETQAEIEAELAEIRVELENLDLDLNIDAEEIRRHAEKLRREIERDVRVHVERHRDREGNARLKIHVNQAAHARHEAGDRGEVVISETFNVDAGGELFIKVPGADVQVETTSGSEAEVEVYLDGRNMERARAFFEELNFEVYESGNTVHVEAETDQSWSWGNWRSRGGARISVVARIPREFNADVSTSGGDISLGELNGRVNLRTSGGDIEMGSVQGPEAILKTSGGDIEVEDINSDEVELRTSGGSIEGSRLEGQRISARTSGGNISMDRVSGDLDARTSGGRIEIEEIDGDVNASTSGGRITVGLVRSTSASLSTSGGSILIEAPASLEADVKLRGNSVELDGGFSFAGSMKRNRAEGEINGGGPRIEASTSGGSVTLRASR